MGRSFVKIVSKLSLSCLTHVSKLSQSFLKVVSKLSKGCLKVFIKGETCLGQRQEPHRDGWTQPYSGKSMRSSFKDSGSFRQKSIRDEINNSRRATSLSPRLAG